MDTILNGKELGPETSAAMVYLWSWPMASIIALLDPWAVGLCTSISKDDERNQERETDLRQGSTGIVNFQPMTQCDGCDRSAIFRRGEEKRDM